MSVPTAAWQDVRIVPAPDPVSSPPKAVWTGTELVVFTPQTPGATQSITALNANAYDPVHETWRAVPAVPVGPLASFVWTDHEIIGLEAWWMGNVRTAAAWDPTTNTWRRLASPPSPCPMVDAGSPPPGARCNGQGGLVWAGNLLIDTAGLSMRAYVAATDSWHELAAPPAEFVDVKLLSNTAAGGTYGIAPLWDGREVLWIPLDVRDPSTGVGAWSYDPATGTWARLPVPPTHPSVAGAGSATNAYRTTGALWNGREVIRDGLDAYNPATRNWRALPGMPSGLPAVSNSNGLGCDPRSTVMGHYVVYNLCSVIVILDDHDTWHLIATAGPTEPTPVPHPTTTGIPPKRVPFPVQPISVFGGDSWLFTWRVPAVSYLDGHGDSVDNPGGSPGHLRVLRLPDDSATLPTPAAMTLTEPF